jgi:UDP-glucose 4-epimerase
VTVLDNFCSGKRENLADAKGDLRVIGGDIRSIGDHAEAIGPVDGIIHLAALISGYDSLADPDAYEDVNIRGLQRVIEYAAANSVKRIVFASSSTVYGNREGVVLTETVPPEPLTVYALTKLTGEHLLRLYGNMHGFSHCSLRLFNVYGPRQATDHPYANVTCKFSHAAANGLPVKLFGDGEQSRDFVFVDDVVRAFMAVLEDSVEEIYNVGTGRTAKINDLIGELGQISGKPLSTEQCPPWPNDIRSIQADTSRFASEFGFAPEVGIGEGLARTVEFFCTTGA